MLHHFTPFPTDWNLVYFLLPVFVFLFSFVLLLQITAGLPDVVSFTLRCKCFLKQEQLSQIFQYWLLLLNRLPERPDHYHFLVIAESYKCFRCENLMIKSYFIFLIYVYGFWKDWTCFHIHKGKLFIFYELFVSCPFFFYII
jgi:hypothetical protein